jgi:energy-coupling factor transporter ATP-binding protein EcfA2
MEFSNNYRKKTILPHRYSKVFYDFWWSKTALWQSFLERLKLEKDVMVLITGDTGSGKSHFTANLCFNFGEREDNFITNDGTKMFNADENFIISPEEFAYKMISKEGQVLWGDEFRRGANRRDWYSPINKAILDRKNTNRKLFNVYFLCVPFESEFDPKLAGHLHMWIWIRRGVGEIYVKRSGIKGGKGLDIQEILDREQKYLKENPKKAFVPPIIHPEYCGRIAFAKLTPGLKRRYDELVKIKKATGDMTDEEKIRYGVEITKEPKQIVNEVIDKIKNGEIKDKRAVWNALEEIKDTTDEKKLKLLNFYLKLQGWDSFNKLFDKKKLEQIEVDW